jgi:hypothetical protein
MSSATLSNKTKIVPLHAVEALGAKRAIAHTNFLLWRYME